MRAECNVIRVMGYTRAASRLRSCIVNACMRVRAIGVTPSFSARPAVMLAIKDNDVSRRFVKHATRLVTTTENESSEKCGLIS